MGVQKSFLLLQIVFVLLAAIIIMMLAIHLATVKEMDHLPEEKVDDLRLQKMETIRADILTRLGLTEPLGSGEPLTEDQKATVAAFRDYQTAEEARRAHANEDNSEKSTDKYTIVGQLHKQGRAQSISDPNTVGPTVSTSASNGQLDGYSILFVELEKLENTVNHTITKAELLLFQDFLVPYKHVPYVHIKVKASPNGPTLIVHNTMYDELEQPGYKTFDITPVIVIWLKGGSNSSLVLEVSAYCVDSPDCGKHIFDGGLGEKSPKLVISRKVEDDPSEQRPKREIGELDEEYSGYNENVDVSNETLDDGYCKFNETTCCLHPLRINFHKDLRFSFILLPFSFNVNYCVGTCPVSWSAAVFKIYSLLGSNSPVSSIQPQCVSRSTGYIEVLMMYNGEFVIAKLEDITVTSCGCA